MTILFLFGADHSAPQMALLVRGKSVHCFLGFDLPVHLISSILMSLCRVSLKLNTLSFR